MVEKNTHCSVIADAYQIAYVSVPHLSNYGHFFIYVVFVVISQSRMEWIDIIHIWDSNQVPYVAEACKVSFGSVPNWSNYGHIFIILYIGCDISEKNVIPTLFGIMTITVKVCCMSGLNCLHFQIVS